jgi:hypothetical protein
MTNDTVQDSKIVFNEFENIFLAFQLQQITFGVIFAALAFLLRYTLYNYKPKAIKEKPKSGLIMIGSDQPE